MFEVWWNLYLSVYWKFTLWTTVELCVSDVCSLTSCHYLYKELSCCWGSRSYCVRVID